MRDVAALAEVGIKTVSRVVNREANVSASTATRVQLAINALRYEPNLLAGNLRRSGQRTQVLGLLIPNVSNPFFAAIHRAVEDIALTRRVAVFASSSDDDPRRETEIVSAFLRRRADGLILATVRPNHQNLQLEQERGTPFVFIDRPPIDLAADSVLSDNHGGAAAATAHLISHGHRSIACLLARSSLFTARERRRGFLDEINRCSIPLPAGYIVEDLTNDAEAYAATSALLDRTDPPTALFCALNLITVGAVRALRERNLHRQVALVGFDDIVLAAELDPALTVIAQDASRIGQLAAERVFSILDGTSTRRQTSVVPTRLIPRGSGELPCIS